MALSCEKLKRLLSREEFCWAIMDSFSHQEIASFMERMGVVYSGIRVASIPHQKLAGDLAEDSLRDNELNKASRGGFFW